MLANGINWWTPTKAMALTDLESALGANGVLINSQDGGFAKYENGSWSGTLTSIAPGQMYKVQTSAACALEVTGAYATDVTVTLLPGHNWFGYTGTQAKGIATALGNFTPASGDTITDQSGNIATYNGSAWTGDLESLVPGKGYVYQSKAEQSRTIMF